MSHRLAGDGRHDGDEPISRFPRSQASFIADSAKWIMALLLAIFTSFLTGFGALAYRLWEVPVILEEHSRELSNHSQRLSTNEQALVTLEGLSQRIIAIENRVEGHSQAIIRANDTIHKLVLNYADMKAVVAENAANHTSIERRLDQIFRSVETHASSVKKK